MKDTKNELIALRHAGNELPERNTSLPRTPDSSGLARSTALQDFAGGA